jgi:hypothetical protein
MDFIFTTVDGGMVRLALTIFDGFSFELWAKAQMKM